MVPSNEEFLLHKCIRQNPTNVSALRAILDERNCVNLAKAIQRKDRRGDNLMHVAASVGATDIFRFFLDTSRALKLNARNGLDETPLMISMKKGHFEIVRMLLERFPDSLELETQNGHWSLFHESCEKGNLAIVKSFLANIPVSQHHLIHKKHPISGLTPFQAAKLEKHFDICGFLCRNGKFLEGESDDLMDCLLQDWDLNDDDHNNNNNDDDDDDDDEKEYEWITL